MTALLLKQKYHIIILLSIILLSSYLLPFDKVLAPNDNAQRPKVLYLNLEIADTPELQELGLSYRESLAPEAGMLFIFPKPSLTSFWMKGMRFPLDIIWLDADMRIINITVNATPESYPTTFHPDTDRLTSFVLEVNAGFCKANNLKVGDVIKIESLPNPPTPR